MADQECILVVVFDTYKMMGVLLVLYTETLVLKDHLLLKILGSTATRKLCTFITTHGNEQTVFFYL